MQKEKMLKRKAPVEATAAVGAKKPFVKKHAVGYQGKKPDGRPGRTFQNHGGRPFGSQKPPEKQDWNKMKQEKKELKLKRKERRVNNKDIYELTSQAKKIYEKLKW